MKSFRVIATATLLLVIAIPGLSMFQDPKTTPKETEHPKSEVERALEDANKRGEHVYRAHLEGEEKDNRTSDGVEPGRAISLPAADYPKIARQARVSGVVVVQVLIDTDGTVVAASVVSGHPLLQASAVSAAREARFTPAKLGGQPVKVTGTITYSFSFE